MTQPGFFARHLDPESRLGEVVFGLIMVLTVTLTASFATDPGPAGVRQLLWATIGCNIAWGLIDALMYLMDTVSRRARDRLLVRRLRAAPDRATTLAMLSEEVRDRLGDIAAPDQQRILAAGLLDDLETTPDKSPLLTRADLSGALACFWLVFLSCVPAALPFLVFDQPSTALRASNLILIAILFMVGQRWAVHIGASRVRTGFVTVAIGLLLVGIAILLGG